MAEAETKYQPALTAQDVMILSGVQNTDPGTILATKPQGVGLVEAISAAKGAAGVKLDTQTMTPKAQQSVDAATIASNALQQRADAAIAGITAEQLRKDDVFQQQKAVLEDTGVQKGIITESTAEIEARNLRLANDAFQNINGVIARGAIEASQRAETIQNLLDERQAIREEPGFIGFLKRRFLAAGVNSDINSNVEEVNTLNSMQTDLISQAAEVAKVRTALLPTKTPEQVEAERKQLYNATTTLVQESTLANAKSREDYFTKVVSFQNEASTAASGEAARQVSISHADYEARTRAILAAKDGAMAFANLTKLEEDMQVDANTYRRIEKAMNLTEGEGKTWYTNLKQANPQAAGAVFQVAYSGKVEDPAALAAAERYVPQDRKSPGKEAIAEQVLNNAGKFESFLLRSGSQAKTMDEFKKLPTTQQTSLQNAFYLSPEGEIIDPIVNANFSDLAASINRSVPTGSIQIPATETSPAKSIKLRDTGELGKQLANLKGDGAAAVELAKIQVLEGGRKPDEVAKELYNFTHNAVTVLNAYKGYERTQFGLPLVSSFPQTITEESTTYGPTTKKKVDLLSYPELLATLVRAKGIQLTGEAAKFSARSRAAPQADKANLFGAP